MRFSVLGPLTVHDDLGRPAPIGGARLRVLLSLLLLRAGRRVDSRDLAEAMWPARDPTRSANALQALVSRLRRALGEEYDSLLARARKIDPRQVCEVADGWWADHRPVDDLDPSERSSRPAQVRRR